MYGGQDLTREALALTVDDTLVVHPRRFDAHRARADGEPARLRPAVAHHQRATVDVAVVAVAREVLLDLDLERRRDHAPRAFTRQLVERQLPALFGRCL